MSTKLQFGVLMHPYQAIDCVGPLDVLSSSSKPYLEPLLGLGLYDESVPEKALDYDFHYIKDTLEPSTHTAGLRLVPTTTLDTCPKLDYLLVGGPDPAWTQDPSFPKYAKFVQERIPELKIVFATCTGAMVLGAMGVLDGLNATVNHQLIGPARQMCPKVKWTDEKQWIVDGKFWTAGGAVAGMDMMAQWVIENSTRDAAECGWGFLDYEPRDVYGKLLKRQKYGLRLQAQTNGA
jgi:putative intracellular protease/amidase